MYNGFPTQSCKGLQFETLDCNSRLIDLQKLLAEWTLIASRLLVEILKNLPEGKVLLIKHWNFCTYALSIFYNDYRYNSTDRMTVLAGYYVVAM